jgi:hypothetical protein
MRNLMPGLLRQTKYPSKHCYHDVYLKRVQGKNIIVVGS